MKMAQPCRSSHRRNCSAIPQTYNLQASWVEGLTHRPDFNQVRAEGGAPGHRSEVEKQSAVSDSRHHRRGGKNDRGQDFTGSLGDISSNKNPIWAIGAIVSIPFSFQESRNNYHAARAKMQQMELQLSKAHQTVIISIDDSLQAAQSAYQRVDGAAGGAVFAESRPRCGYEDDFKTTR